MFNFNTREKKTARSQQVNTRVEPELKATLDDASEMLGASVADIAYDALQAWTKAYKKQQGETR